MEERSVVYAMMVLWEHAATHGLSIDWWTKGIDTGVHVKDDRAID